MLMEDADAKADRPIGQREPWLTCWNRGSRRIRVSTAELKFEPKNWPDLRAAIRRLADAVDAVEDGTNTARSIGSKECWTARPGNLPVVCIWMKQAVDGKFRFVTLKPS
jgi:hypothetical protein